MFTQKQSFPLILFYTSMLISGVIFSCVSRTTFRIFFRTDLLKINLLSFCLKCLCFSFWNVFFQIQNSRLSVISFHTLIPVTVLGIFCFCREISWKFYCCFFKCNLFFTLTDFLDFFYLVFNNFNELQFAFLFVLLRAHNTFLFGA